MVKTLIILAIFLLTTSVFDNVFKFNIVLASTTGKNDQPDPWSQIGTILATVFGIGGLFWGIFTYRGAQTLKRQQVLFPLIKEFDKPGEMSVAKSLLDDFYVKEPLSRYFVGSYYITPLKEWKLDSAYYHKTNLGSILSVHPVSDAGEAAIRKSFDALLDFFAKLEYLLDVNLITSEEIGYFAYYIYKAADEPSVTRYVIDYKFPLRGKLHYNLFSPL